MICTPQPESTIARDRNDLHYELPLTMPRISSSEEERSEMIMTGGKQEGKSLWQWVSRNSPSPLALGLGLCAKKVPLDPPKYESQADADGRTDEPRKRPRRGRNDASRECARGGDRPTARDRSRAQNMRIKGMGKGGRSLARPLVCSGRTREMERFEKNQVKQNIRPTEQGIERGSNKQNQTSVGFSRP